MATAAQKKAQDNFKKAIAYRKKTGCTLKQAFAHVKSGKVGSIIQNIKRKATSAKKNVAYKVIDKTAISANKKEKAALSKAKKLIKNTYIGVVKKKAAVKKAAVKKAAPKKLKYVGVKKTASGASRYEYKLAGMSNFKKSKETQFYEILKDNNIMYSNFSVYGKTYTKLFANVKTIVSTGEKLIAPIVEDLYKKIENLPLKISVKPIGKKSKHYEYIDGKNQNTIHQWTEYKVSL
jgi:hypothetical protein